MGERLVEIPISKALRSKIKKRKKKLTYEQYLKKILGAGS
jgi:hypothetical protein